MPRPPLLYRALRAVVRVLMRVFFREIAVEGRANVPEAGGGLLVAWHPNGIVDPALILSTFPGQIVFGARDGLLRWPLLGALMRGLGTVPIYRAQDGGAPAARRADNDRSLGALADRIASGSFAALFPEGVSHDDPALREVKTGAARLYLRARAEAAAPPAIVPVGLHYDRKDLFRSDVLVAYHPPLRLDGLPEAGDGEAAVRALTDRIEAALVEAVRPTEDWPTHRLMHRAYALMRAEDDVREGVDSGPASVTDRARGFRMVWHGYRARRESHPEEVESLRRDVAAYDRLLRTAGLTDADLDRPPNVASPLLVALFVLQALLVAVLLPPILLLGAAVNVLPFLALNAVARRFSSEQKDTATVKILGGIVLYPLAWVVAGVLAGLGAARLHDLFPALPNAPVAAGLTVAFLSAVGGALALRSGELAKESRRAIQARLFRRRRRDVIARLQLMRTDLHARFSRLAEGLDLPAGVV